MTRSLSFSRPMTGSSCCAFAIPVRFTPICSSHGGFYLGHLPLGSAVSAACWRGSPTFAVAHQTEKKVFRSYVVVVETDRLILGKREDSLGAVVKAIERSHLLRLLKVYRHG